MPPIGDHAWVRMPCSSPKAWTSAWEKYGCCSIWLTAGTTPARSSSVWRWSTMKLETPIARTLPSASSVSRAVGLERAVEGARQGLVEDEQVDLLDAELGGALLEVMQRLVVAVVGA